MLETVVYLIIRKLTLLQKFSSLNKILVLRVLSDAGFVIARLKYALDGKFIDRGLCSYFWTQTEQIVVTLILF